MKKYFFGFIVLNLSWFVNETSAQDSASLKEKEIAYFLNGAFGGANKGILYGGGASIIFRNTWGISFSIKKNIFNAKQLPNDYYPASDIIGSDPVPEDFFEFYSLALVKEFGVNSRKFKLGFEAGPSLVITGKNSFKSIPVTQGYFGHSSNYETAFEKKKTLGVFIRPKINYTLSKTFGVELSGLMGYNKFQSLYGVEIDVLFGKLCFK